VAAAIEAGRYDEATALLDEWDRRLPRTTASAIALGSEAADVREFSAHLAVASGDIRRGAEQWIAAARIRMQSGPPDAPELAAAVDNAEHLWRKLPADDAIELGTALVTLRQAVPDPHRRLAAIRRRLEVLHAG
jgi:hypothetical protein